MDQIVSFDASLMLPELLLAGTAVAVLIFDLVAPKRHVVKTSGALVGVVAALVGVLTLSGAGESTLQGTFVVDQFALTAKGILIASVALAICTGVVKRDSGEYLVLMLIGAVAVSALVSSRDLIPFLISLETLAIASYLLVAWNSRSRFRAEGTFKHFLFGVVSTAVMLFGASYLFGMAGSTKFSDIALAISNESLSELLIPAVVLTFAGIAFKIAVVPLHFWAPDTYQAAPIPVTVFLAVTSKLAGVFALLSLCAFALPYESTIWKPIVWFFAVSSMVVGNLIALKQDDLVRMLAWSSVGHSGFLLVPLASVNVSVTNAALEATFIYAVLYVMGTVAAFGAVVYLSDKNSDVVPIAQLRGSFRAQPLIAVALVIALLSLAGIPPFGGWFGKFVILRTAVDAIESGGAWALTLVVVVVVMTVVALAYYASVLARMWRNSTPKSGVPLVDQSAVPLADEAAEAAESAESSELTNDSLSGQESLVASRYFVIIMAMAILVVGIMPGVVASIGGEQFLGV